MVLKCVHYRVETSLRKAMDAQNKKQKQEKSCTTLEKRLSLSPSLCKCFFFFKILIFFLSSALVHLSNMPSSFFDKVPVLKDKTECEGPSTFPEGL